MQDDIYFFMNSEGVFLDTENSVIEYNIECIGKFIFVWCLMGGRVYKLCK